MVDGRDGDDCKPYWSRVEIPTWMQFFSLICVRIHTNEFIQLLYKLYSTNSYTVGFFVPIHTFLYELYSTNSYKIFNFFLRLRKPRACSASREG